jgi:dihydroorotase
MMALQQAVKNGLVDCIASHHLPQNWDNKVCEFEYAKSGMIGLQTSFAAVNSIIPDLSSEQLIGLFSTNARNIFAIPTTNINVGSKAEITLFTRTGKTTLTTQNNQSKSVNSAFLNKELNGKVLGILHKGQIFTN